MNLVALEIENYRQFQGLHNFTPGEQAMVAVIGRNGTGKTTLFEAIEWCLYNPPRIKSADIQNRVGAGRPRAKVTLEHPQTGERFEIERESKRGSTVASIYRTAQPDTPIVQGTKQVTDYVAKQLLGLSHKAFVATFFTRQKELSFFGDSSLTDRRREVGRLLGLETIRIAQLSIGDKRLQKQNEARAKQSHYDDESSSTDFAGQRAHLEQLIAQREQIVSTTSGTMGAAVLDHEAARLAFSLEQSRSRKHNELSLQGSELQGMINECAAQITAAVNNLREISQAETELSRLAPIAAREPEWRERIEAQERDKRKSEEIQDLHRQAVQIEETRSRIMLSVAEAERIIDGLTDQSRLIAENAPLYGDQEIELLLTRARRVDSQAVAKLAIDLHACAQVSVQTRDRAALFQKWSNAAANLDQQRVVMLQAGNPREAISLAGAERARLQELATTARATAESARAVRKPLAGLHNRLAGGSFADHCPTCGRPFQAGELDGYLRSLSAQTEDLDSQIQRHTAAQTEAEGEAALAAEREKAARTLAADLQTLETRIADSKPHIDEAAANLRQSEEQLAAMLIALRRDNPPSEDEIASVQEQTRAAQRTAAQIPRLEQLHVDLKTTLVSWNRLSTHLEDRGPSQYDGEAHQIDHASWEQAKHAAAQIVVLQARVENRPLVQLAREAAELRSRDAGLQLGERQQMLAELNFQPQTLGAKREAESALLEHLNQAVEQKHQAESELASVRKDLTTLLDWQKRLERIRDEAIQAQRDADELDRMYREFNRFEQHVAQTVTPALADLTSQLVSAVTDGRYEQVQFNDNFGIEVSDGDEEQYFPLSQFSGGERDVIALCARLALSQLIGGQSQNPLQFVVMDEVFGSLDRERRMNLMDTLQKLVDETGVFKQLFVISHVDDVQASPAFDEIWRVTQTVDGTSKLEQVTTASVPEDM